MASWSIVLIDGFHELSAKSLSAVVFERYLNRMRGAALPPHGFASREYRQEQRLDNFATKTNIPYIRNIPNTFITLYIILHTVSFIQCIHKMAVDRNSAQQHNIYTKHSV